MPRTSRHNRGRKPLYKDFYLVPEPDVVESVTPLRQNNDFLFSENAKSLTIETANSLTEDAARDVFIALRWPDGPTCLECGSARLYKRRARWDWQCSECVTGFSATSGCLFASHKTSFRTILAAIAVAIGASPKRTQSDAARAIGITFKAAHTLISKLREMAKLAPLPDVPEFEIGKPRYIDGRFMSTRCWWSDTEKAALEKFVGGGFNPDESAIALGRSPTSIAHYARDRGIILPQSWSALITPIRAKSLPRVALAYPYIMTKRPEHADLLAINDLVPRAFPSQMRADICQEMMLAVLEGRVTIDEIKANREQAAWFLKKFWMDNHEDSGHAVSLSGGEDDDREFYDIASSLSAKDWHDGEVYERTRHVSSTLNDRFQAPTQVDDTWRMQISRVHRGIRAEGKHYTFREVADMVENEGYRRDSGQDLRSHAIIRAEQRYGLQLNRRAIREIINRIESGLATLIERETDCVVRLTVPYGGHELPIVYDHVEKTLITILPVAR